MDFFQHQDEARAKTRSLVRIFILAVVLLIAAIYIPLAYVLSFGEFAQDSLGSLAELPGGVPFDPGALLRWYQPRLLLGVSVCVLAVVGLGSLMKTIALRGGGAAVAESLGGRAVAPATAEPRERVLLNVVEEMAIASGLPVPGVYILSDEPGINAFAAGWSMEDAAVAVTDGALDQLTRDELQGVIAHEFSHILNGDMRLNIRLMGLLHGILMISLIGRFILRALAQGTRSTKSSKEGAAFFVVGALVAALLVAVGSIGWFFGQLIKAGVSRQREFLADASAVQFTRNPVGLAGALHRIVDSSSGSRLRHARAEEASHMLFGSPLKAGFWDRMLASHPSVEDRIGRLGFEAIPGATRQPPGGSPAATGSSSTRGFVPSSAGEAPAAPSAVPPASGESADYRSLDPTQVVRGIGTLDAEHLAAGSALLRSLPEPLRTGVESPLGAVATLYALLLDADPQARVAQIQTVFGDSRPAVFDVMMASFEDLQHQPASVRLPLAELAMLPLRTLPPTTLGPVLDTMTRLIEADGQVELFEFALNRVLQRRLDGVRRWDGPVATRNTDSQALLPDVSVLLSALARVGHSAETEVQRAFDHGAHCISLGSGLALVPEGACTLAVLADCLERLSSAVPGLRREVVDAASHCVLADGQVNLREAELLRVVAIDLGCPMPVFLDN